MDANPTVPELRTYAERAQVNVEDLNDQLTASGYVVRKGACSTHDLNVGVLTQTKLDSRWGEVRMLAPAQVKLNYVSSFGVLARSTHAHCKPIVHQCHDGTNK